MILRKHRRKGFTTIDNELLSDKRLSFKARGLAAFLLSKPDDWRIRLTHLSNESPQGKAAVVSAIQELKDHGYYRITRIRSDDNTRIVDSRAEIADFPAFRPVSCTIENQHYTKPVLQETDTTTKEGVIPNTDNLPNTDHLGDSPETGTIDDGFSKVVKSLSHHGHIVASAHSSEQWQALVDDYSADEVLAAIEIAADSMDSINVSSQRVIKYCVSCINNARADAAVGGVYRHRFQSSDMYGQLVEFTIDGDCLVATFADDKVARSDNAAWVQRVKAQDVDDALAGVLYSRATKEKVTA